MDMWLYRTCSTYLYSNSITTNACSTGVVRHYPPSTLAPFKFTGTSLHLQIWHVHHIPRSIGNTTALWILEWMIEIERRSMESIDS